MGHISSSNSSGHAGFSFTTSLVPGLWDNHACKHGDPGGNKASSLVVALTKKKKCKKRDRQIDRQTDRHINRHKKEQECEIMKKKAE